MTHTSSCFCGEVKFEVTGEPGIVNAVSAPDGGAVTGACIAGIHETFVTSNVATLSARTSRTRP